MSERKRPEPKPDTLEKIESGLNAALRKRGIFLERRNFAVRGRRSWKQKNEHQS